MTACQQPIGPVPTIMTPSPSRTSSCSIPFNAQANGSATVARSEGSSGGSPMRFFVAMGGTAANSAYAPGYGSRSEEHTSELQSRSDLVCRLLLEKKKKKKKQQPRKQTTEPLPTILFHRHIFSA